MWTVLRALGAAAWMGVTSPIEGFRRLETTMLYQPYVDEVLYMGMGCIMGGAGGAMVGSMVIVTTWGAVATPFTIEKGAIVGCAAGTTVGIVGAKTYNAAAFYVKHMKE